MLRYFRVYKIVTPPEMNIGVNTFQTPGDISFVFVFWHTLLIYVSYWCIHVKGVGVRCVVLFNLLLSL